MTGMGVAPPIVMDAGTATKLDRALTEAADSLALFYGAHRRGMALLAKKDYPGVYDAIDDECLAIEKMSSAISALEGLIERQLSPRLPWYRISSPPKVS